MNGNPSSWLNLPQRLASPLREFDNAIWQALSDLRVGTPGIVTAFDPVAQTVTVQPAVQERISKNVQDSSGNTVPVATFVNLPELVNVPILLVGGGGFTVCPPIAVGDECFVIFADACIDAWWQSGGVQPQVDRRRHDLSDGFALVGVRSQPRKLAGYNATKFQIRSDDGSVVVELGAGEITLKAANITVNGNLTVDGGLSVTGAVSFDEDITIDGKDFLLHKHTGVATGGSNTGPVL